MSACRCIASIIEQPCDAHCEKTLRVEKIQCTSPPIRVSHSLTLPQFAVVSVFFPPTSHSFLLAPTPYWPQRDPNQGFYLGSLAQHEVGSFSSATLAYQLQFNNFSLATLVQQLQLSNFSLATLVQQLQLSNFSLATLVQQLQLSNFGLATLAQQLQLINCLATLV